MSDPNATQTFQCSHCGVGIEVPANLPPTTAPCPKCGKSVTSPSFDAPATKPVEVVKEAVPAEAVIEKVPEVETEAGEGAQEAPGQGGGKGKMVIASFALLAALLLAAAVMKILLSADEKENSEAAVEEKVVLSPEERRDNAYRSRGWISEAEGVLGRFLSAETVAERASLTIRGSRNEAKMAALFDNSEEDGFRTPVEVFSPVTLSDSDSKRGFFLMTYNRPEQFAMRGFFRPVPPLRVRYGLEEPNNWLISEASLTNFVDRPLKVMAFFKKTPEGLRLDWETYAQTKYRLLKQLVENPEPGAQGVFRVFVQEDVDLNGRGRDGFSVFRFSDPANIEDFAKVLVKDESELGKAFAPLKWRDKVVRNAPVRNATVSLVWSDEAEPSLQMGELICWEFINLGGERGNWKEAAGEQ